MPPSRLLRATVVASASLFASVAQAVPYMPSELPATIDTLSILAPEAGPSFTVVLGSERFVYAERANEGLSDAVAPSVRLTPRRDGWSVLTTREGTDVRVATGAETFRFDPAASPPSALDATSFGASIAVGVGESASKAPKLALWGSGGLRVGTVGSALDRATPVKLPDIQPLRDVGAFWGNDTFGLFAYSAGPKGAKVVLLDGSGAPREGAPLSLDGANATKIMATPIGGDVLVTQLEELSAWATRISADGTIVERRQIDPSTVAIVADPNAPGGSDALVVLQKDRGRISVSSWSALTAAGAPKPATPVTDTVSGTYAGGACSANGCMLGFAAGRAGHTLVWVGRDGRTAVQIVPSAAEPTGASGGGGSRPPPVLDTVPTGAEDVTPSSGCSAASSHAGGGFGGGLLVGLGLVVARLRRRTTSSR